LDEKLSAIVKGAAQPADTTERLLLAELCRRYRQRYVAAARFYADAFAARPALADDLRSQHRYNAACAAALAGTGHGQDGASVDGTDGAEVPYSALPWLQEDRSGPARHLAGKQPGTAEQVRRTLLDWQNDTDLATVRDSAALARLPEAEQVAWQNLWAQVAA